MSSAEIVFVSESLADTDRLGAALAKCLPGGATVALSGTLGAGKTRLVQALAAHCGIPEGDVVSPTFVLCHEHHGERTLIHLDAYRIADDDEFLELGVDEYFDSDAIVLVEWAERVAACLPLERLEIHIEVAGEHARTFRITAIGDAYMTTIECLAACQRHAPIK